MSFEKLKLCTRVLAPKRTYVTNIQTWKTTPTPEVLEWFDKNNIRDFELVGAGSDLHSFYVYYFVNEWDAVMFSLRWS